jgi:hypothetical protein
MNPITALSAQQLRHAADLQERIQELQGKLAKILGQDILVSLHTSEPPRKRKRRMSAAGRKAIAAAAKARWAKIKAKQENRPRKAKRKFSAAGRAALAAAAKARWAKAKAAGKSRL